MYLFQTGRKCCEARKLEHSSTHARELLTHAVCNCKGFGFEPYGLSLSVGGPRRVDVHVHGLWSITSG